MNRVYYCCKYVTKAQKQAGSMAPVALVLFSADTKEKARTSRDQSVINTARRRVASMAYNMTNSQENAGPLVVLYLLRGSCCYSSHQCCKLPLRDALKQLQQHEDYDCGLVQTTESVGNEDTNMFRAASVLDGYLFRPNAFNDVS